MSTRATEPVPGWSDPSLRRVVAHYHLFKNAGTSVDEALKQVFGARWVNVEAERGHHLPAEEFQRTIESRHEPVVFSSHTASLPVPSIAKTAVLPILFLRHPIDRVASVYKFERRQFPVRTRGAAMAKLLGFRRYVKWRIDYDSTIAGFQVERLSAGSTRPGTVDGALEVLEQLPFVGVVEHYDASLRALEAHLQQAFPDATLEAVHENVTKGRASRLEDRLEKTRAELGNALYEELVARNRGDFALHEAASARWT